MKFKILSRKNNIRPTDIIQSLKKNADRGASYTSLEALNLFRSIENRNEDEIFTSQNLLYALKDFYILEMLPDEVEIYLRKNVSEYEDFEEKEAETWVDTLSEREKRFMEIIISKHRIFPACG